MYSAFPAISGIFRCVELLVRDLSPGSCPDIPIWLGGPEVSYDSRDVLRAAASGEGRDEGGGGRDLRLPVRDCGGREIASDEDLAGVDGITCRGSDGQIVENPWREPMDLDRVPFVYQDLEQFET